MTKGLQGVWCHEATWRILTLDSILLLHASQFCILGGKPLVPEKIFGLTGRRRAESTPRESAGRVQMRLRSGRVIGVRRVIGCPATMPMTLVQVLRAVKQEVAHEVSRA